MAMAKGVPDLTPAMLAKRAERARKKAAQQTPEALAATAVAAAAEADAKRERRRQRNAQDAGVLQAWGIKNADGAACLLVDIGANLTKLKGENSFKEQLTRCSLTGVTTVIVTGTSVAGSRAGLALVRSHSAARMEACEGAPPCASHRVSLHSTAGVHPHDASTCDETTIPALRALLSAPECVAVGECGLDYDRMFSPRQVQLHWFERQARLAVELGLPMFLHERDVDVDGSKGLPLGSQSDLLHVLEASGVHPSRACIHCFTGSAEQLRTYAEGGYRIGLTGFVCMTKRGAHVRDAIRAGDVPLGSMMLETDAPFMKPDKLYLPAAQAVTRGQCEPCLVPSVCRVIAECLGVPEEEVARVTTANARAFFGLVSATESTVRSQGVATCAHTKPLAAKHPLPPPTHRPQLTPLQPLPQSQEPPPRQCAPQQPRSSPKQPQPQPLPRWRSHRQDNTRHYIRSHSHRDPLQNSHSRDDA